jgi:hypothetical protein
MKMLNVLIVGLLFFAGPFAFAEKPHAVHLILLSGQSNMANMDPARVFTPEVEKYLGADNVVVVKVAQGGQPIRRWYKRWKVTGDQNPNQIGDLYGKLMEQAKTAMQGKSLKSVTLIWMQGERDAKENLSDHYKEAFLGILEQLKSDLGVKEINYVIGRISDSGLGKNDWDKIRGIQQKLGEAGPRSAWVNTDDLNDDKGTNNLHYSKQGYDLLAKRYVEKVKELVK